MIFPFTFAQIRLMMLAKSWFKDWFNSPYYHKLYFQRDEAEAALFIDKLIDHLNPAAGCRMLDVACGKGRHSIQLASKGFEVTGIDLAEDSIREAKNYETDQLQFFLHDMRLPFWINYFDLAFNFFTSFGYFKTRREHDNGIRTIAQALKLNGHFIIDYLNVHYAEDHFVHQSNIAIDDVNYYITKWFDETHFYKKIVVEDDNLKEPLEYIEQVNKFNLGDFTDMFAYQGLQIQEVYGDYSFNSYDLKHSPRLIIIAKKIKVE
ncbi:MAG: class I SAM-dependent methyltransferase [Ginsengibacter sp.]